MLVTPRPDSLHADSRLVAAVRPSPNVGERRAGCRPSLIVLHYTGMSTAAKAIHWLSHPDSKVSCHYVVDEAGAITQMVPEALRAWHAGASHWAGETDINSASIGIEIQNPGHANGYPDFPPAQMQAIAALCRDIMGRRGIRPEGVLAHSDVAPGRKIDPGEKFDWAGLAQAGVGHWVAPAPPDCSCATYDLGDEGSDIAEAQELLCAYGYDVETHGRFDERTRIVVRAFQQHFRQACADGRLDAGTLDTLRRLVSALPVCAVS
jgi:N-acetylmuramoyl-L-alanine amidase